MTAQRGRVGVEIELYSFFNLGARSGWVFNATLQQFYPGKSSDTHWRGLDGPQGSVCTGLVKRKRLGLTGYQVPDLPARSKYATAVPWSRRRAR